MNPYLRERPPNNAVNATVLASRRLQGKRRAARPARYRGRSAGRMNSEDYGGRLPGSTSFKEETSL
jgi:hypothetical protein